MIISGITPPVYLKNSLINFEKKDQISKTNKDTICSFFISYPILGLYRDREPEFQTHDGQAEISKSSLSGLNRL